MAEVVDRLRTALAERYRIERELGRGGMATVFLAHDLKHGRDVAIKVMHPEVASDLGAERFLREIRTAARLVHPHVLALFDSGEADGLLYYTMPFIGGESLADRLAREGPLPIEDALRIAREVADALAYAHSQGIVHRDIKPANILLVNDTHACVSDFGLAHALSSASSHRLTATGITVGSPLYMAPEQIGGREDVDGRADVYSLGCVLVEMLSGKPPFEAESLAALLTKHLVEEPSALHLPGADAGAAIEGLCRQLLAKRPESRPTAERVSARLRELRHGETASLPTMIRGLSRNRRALRIAGGTAALALAGLIGIALMPPAAPRADPIRVLVLPIGSRPPSIPASSFQDVQSTIQTALETVPEVQAIDGRTILEGESWRAVPLGTLLERARAVGADYLLSTDLIAGSSPRLVVDLYSTREGTRLLRETGGGSGESMARAAERVSLGIAQRVAEREQLHRPGSDYLVGATTSSVALQHFLEGQRHFRAGDTDRAVDAFERSIAADSNFALAYYRLSVAETWEPRFSYSAALAAVEAGLSRSANLSPVWTRLLQAQRHFVLRESERSIDAFQGLVAENPGLVDAWFGLAEALYHYGGVAGYRTTDAAPAFQQVIAADSTFAPIFGHMVEICLYADDPECARRYLALLPAEETEGRLYADAVALAFGDPDERRIAHERLRHADRRTLSLLVAVLARSRNALETVDSVATYLTGPDRTPDDRLRGSEYRVLALAAQNRWDEAAEVWRRSGVRSHFNPWIVHAYFAGLPADSLVAPMFAWAQREVDAGRAPRFDGLGGDAENAFRALAHRATLHGDSSQVEALLERAAAAARDASPADPVPAAFIASLQSRLALLAGDTAAAISLLEASALRPNNISWFQPLTDMAPQRRLLAQLESKRGNPSRAERWVESFEWSLALGDVLFRDRDGSSGRRSAAPPHRSPSQP